MKRLTALDSLRGGLLLMMAMNHIPSDLRIFTDQPFGYFSAAEGFVFLSGLLAGKIYAQRARSHGLRDASLSALGRAYQIYRAHLICVGLVFGWCALHVQAVGSPPPGSPELFVERPLASQLAAAALIYRPGLLDILPLYCVSFLLVPAILAAVQTGRTRYVLAVSAAVWASTNLFATREPYVDGLIHTGAIPISAWQFLFVIAFVLGTAWSTGQLRLARPRPVALVAAGALALLFAIARHGLIPLPPVAAILTDKLHLAPLRLAGIAVAFWLLAQAVRAYPQSFACAPLELLGRHSLPVFTVHVVVAIVLLGLPQLFAVSALGRAAGAAILVGSMFLTAHLCAARSGARFANTRLREYTDPGPLPRLEAPESR